MKIYLVRHGESEGNLSGIHQPDACPLSFEGMRQADKLAQRFAGVRVDKIISSPLMRTKQTAEAIAKETGAEIEFEGWIREVKNPSMVVGRSHNEAEVRQVWDKIRSHRNEPSFHLYDEENFFDVRARTLQFIQDLSKRSDQSLIVVSHGGAICSIVGLMIFGDEFSSREFYRMHEHMSVTNTGITICDYQDPMGWRVTTFNDAAHLLD